MDFEVSSWTFFQSALAAEIDKTTYTEDKLQKSEQDMIS